MTSNFRPPPLYIGNTDSRTLGFHNYQVFDVCRGSGDVNRESGVGLFINSCAGAGPLYDIWLVDEYPQADSGVDNIQIGDHLLVCDDINDTYTGGEDIAWYRYDITNILTSPNANSGEFRVKYINDTVSNGDDSPCDLHYRYIDDGYGSPVISKDMNMVIRHINVDFLLGDY